MSLPEGVTIVEGGYYKNREGAIIGPMRLSGLKAHPWSSDGQTYAECGRWDFTAKVSDPWDLVEIVKLPEMSAYLSAGPVYAAAEYAGATGALLPVDKQERKDTPVYSGALRYFPLALAEVARLSKAGNDKHNPGEPLHWSRDKSNDHLDCVARHLLEAGTVDVDDGHRHSTKLAWRALANLQIELENAAKEAQSNNRA